MWNARTFQFLQNINPENRLGRFSTGDDPIPMGAPVVRDATGGPSSDGNDGFDRTVIKLASGSDDLTSLAGIVWWDDASFAGEDPVLTRPADVRLIPANTGVYVVKGVATRFRVTNVDARTVGGGLRSYAAITQVADLDQATPTAAVGKLLQPTTTPNDTNGYWDVTTTRADGWAEITAVDFDLRFIEAQLIA